MATIRNPVLPGFNPDPCICRAGDDFYIATSTFEWLPGVQIHHSRDLVHWRLLTHPLTRPSQLNVIGDGDSCGIWAPALSYHDGTFYLIYTDQKSWQAGYMDAQNFMVTAPAITGPWSEPVFLNASGFDPSLFHDDDGRKWLVNMLWDHRAGRHPFAGIVLQECSPAQKGLVGERKLIFPGTDLRVTEGPHLYKVNRMYYLVCAEGGTGHGHCVTVARSKKIDGPYEVHPCNPVLHARNRPDLPLQKAGHGSLVQTPGGEWYMAHLCSRHVRDNRCPLGRETAIQKVRWTEDGWPVLAGGNPDPQVDVPAPNLPPHPFAPEPARDDFDSPHLSPHFATLRVYADPTWLSLTERPGFLRLFGRQSLSSRHEQSLVARRLQHMNATVTTKLDFAPQHFQHMAGLAAFYNVRNYYYLAVTHDESAGKSVRLFVALEGKNLAESLPAPLPLDSARPVYLRLTWTRGDIQFLISQDGEAFTPVGPVLDGTLLSDDMCNGFTGTMLAMCAQDLAGTRHPADFDFFEYKGHTP